MKKEIDELINDKGAIISGSEKPHPDMRTTSASTTDQHVNTSRQGTVWMNYRRYYGEAELPFSKVADKYQKQPDKFYTFLKKKKSEDKFEQYFERKPDAEIQNESYLNSVVEDVLSKRSERSGIVSNRLFEDLSNDNPFLGKCVTRLSELMADLEDTDKELILGYLRKNG